MSNTKHLYHFYIMKCTHSIYKLGITRDNKVQNRLYNIQTNVYRHAIFIGHTLALDETFIRQLESHFKKWKGVDGEYCGKYTVRRILQELNKRDIAFKVLNKLSTVLPASIDYGLGSVIKVPVTSEIESISKADYSHCVIANGLRGQSFGHPRVREGRAMFNHNGYTYTCLPTGQDLACVRSFDETGKFGERVVELEVVKKTPIKVKPYVKQKAKTKRRRKNSGPKYCNNKKRHHGISQKSIDLAVKTQVDFTKKVA